MVKSRLGYRTPIPTTTANKQQTKALSFKDGVDTYKDNDDLSPTELVAAYDARFAKIGRYKTRKGLDRYSVPIGEAVNVQQTGIVGPSYTAVSNTAALAMKLTTVGSGRATRADVLIRTAPTDAATKTNLVLNPNFETGAASTSAAQYNGILVAGSVDNTTGAISSSSYKAVITGGADVQNWSAQIVLGNQNLTNGVTYTFSCYVKTSDSRTISIGFEGSSSYYPSGWSTTTSWARYTGTFTASATSTVTPKFFMNTGASGTVWVDGLMFEVASTASDYFDGSTVSPYPNVTYAWTGTAGNSLSTMTITTATLPTGCVLVELRADNAGSPSSTVLARGSIASSSVSSTASYLPVYFVQAPLLSASTDYWIVVRGQESVVGQYFVGTTTASSAAKVSVNSGASWSSTSYSANVKLYTSTTGGVKGVYRSYRPNGTKVTAFWHGTTGYTVNDGTGATTAFKTGLSGSATLYRAQMVQDALYFVNGFEKPYKYDFTTTTQITAAPYTPSLIMEHKGLMFYNDVNDGTRIFYSNFGAYDTFTSTDFIYVPAPKSYDKIVAFAKLNGVFYPFGRRNKFQLLGSDNATFSLDEATSQRGTFSQESVVFDANFIYHADEEGVWKFNGTDEKNLAQPFLEDYLAISNKDSICLEVHSNRLYIFYTPNGSADNTECFVYNLTLDKYESLDKGAIVGRTFSRYAQDDIFIQASPRVAALYYGELDSNDYCNLGDQLQYELQTGYSHFNMPGQLKRAPKWRPTFNAVSGSYSVQAGYVADYGSDASFTDVSLAGSGVRYDAGLHYDAGLTYASGSQLIEPTNLLVNGYFKRLQRRYRHIAAREPVEMDTEILTIEAQRLI